MTSKAIVGVQGVESSEEYRGGRRSTIPVRRTLLPYIMRSQSTRGGGVITLAGRPVGFSLIGLWGLYCISSDITIHCITLIRHYDRAKIAISHRLRHVRILPYKLVKFPGVSRQLHATPIKGTDGVFKGLTEMRVRTPWIDALRKKQEEGRGPSPNLGASDPSFDRDLAPKKMSDSYHRVVRDLKRRGRLHLAN